MKYILIFYFMVGLAVFTSGAALPHRQSIPFGDTLYPPRNFVARQIECGAYLTWQKPIKPDGTVPPGLIGYYLYRKGHAIQYISGPDTTFAYDDPDPANWEYKATAYYDLSFYGHPGQFGQSEFSNPDTLYAGCEEILPFSESWDHSSFTFRNWKFFPSQGNWVMADNFGNPQPSAEFKGIPVWTDYQFDLISNMMDGIPWSCAKITVSFDLKLENINPSGHEILSVATFSDSSWTEVTSIPNTFDSGWINYNFDISNMQGKMFKIRFSASGWNSADITAWYIDNIYISAQCLPPVSPAIYIQGSHIVKLTWIPPCSGKYPYNKVNEGSVYIPGEVKGSIVEGYNVYRSDSSGQSPFTKLNNRLIGDTVFYDSIPENLLPGSFSYYITALFRDTISQALLCESTTSDTLTAFMTGVSAPYLQSLTVYPNPALKQVTISGDFPLESYQLLDYTGRLLSTVNTAGLREVRIDVVGLCPGIYFLRIYTGKGMITRKLVLGQAK
jgi:hypothetical protein